VKGGLFFEHAVAWHEVSARRCILHASGKKLLAEGLFQTGKGFHSQQERPGRKELCSNMPKRFCAGLLWIITTPRIGVACKKHTHNCH